MLARVPTISAYDPSTKSMSAHASPSYKIARMIIGTRFLFFFSCERHGFASARDMILLPREAPTCLSETEKCILFLVFPFVRGTVLLPRETRLCLDVA